MIKRKGWSILETTLSLAIATVVSIYVTLELQELNKMNDLKKTVNKAIYLIDVITDPYNGYAQEDDTGACGDLFYNELTEETFKQCILSKTNAGNPFFKNYKFIDIAGADTIDNNNTAVQIKIPTINEHYCLIDFKGITDTTETNYEKRIQYILNCSSIPNGQDRGMVENMFLDNLIGGNYNIVEYDEKGVDFVSTGGGSNTDGYVYVKLQY